MHHGKAAGGIIGGVLWAMAPDSAARGTKAGGWADVSTLNTSSANNCYVLLH